MSLPIPVRSATQVSRRSLGVPVRRCRAESVGSNNDEEPIKPLSPIKIDSEMVRFPSFRCGVLYLWPSLRSRAAFISFPMRVFVAVSPVS